jgi:mRNA interferase MazF
MNPGDIWLVDIPYLGTHEQSGKRPAVVIAKVTKSIATIIPCTSNDLALRFPFTYLIKSDDENKLSSPTIALVFHIRAIDTSLLKNKIGKLDNKSLIAIRKLAKKLIG